MPTNFELNRLKPREGFAAKLDIVEKPENRVHKPTDSNGAQIKTELRIEYIPSDFVFVKLGCAQKYFIYF